MMTNILAMLHTTAAYQTAALQLMVGQANFAAKQLDLKEPLPIVIPADTNKWEVAPPPMGIGGYLSCSNYSFEFSNGQLRSIRKQDWLRKISPPVQNVLDLGEQPSLLDTNSAYQLATQRLASISVDISSLVRTSPPAIFQVIGRKRDALGRPLPGDGNIAITPLFMIGWGEDPINSRLRARLKTLNRPLHPRPPSRMSPVYMEILGTTREIIELDVCDESLFKSAPLQLTNAAELLGPLPPKSHFIEGMVGGKDAYKTVALPDEVEAWLLNGRGAGENIDPLANRTGAVELKTVDAKQFSDALLNFDSYSWGTAKMCSPEFGVRLRFTRGGDTVEFLLCYECKILEVSHNGKIQTQEMNFDYAEAALVKAIQSVFPDDNAIKKLNNEN